MIAQQTLPHWKTRLAQKWHGFLYTEATPHSLALAFALGTLISVLPTPGLNIALAAGLTAVNKSLNRSGLFGAVAVWNAVVVAPLYALSYELGEFLFGQAALSLPAGMPVWVETAVRFCQQFLIGNLIIAAVTAAASYGTVYGLAAWRQKKKGQPLAPPADTATTIMLTLSRRTRQHQQNNRTQHRNDKAPHIENEVEIFTRHKLHHHAANQCTDDTNDDIGQAAAVFAADNQVGRPSSQCAKNNPTEQSHVKTSIHAVNQKLAAEETAVTQPVLPPLVTFT